jgi:hypothetical protein
MSFDPSTAEFELSIEADAAVAAPTTVYVPRVHYPDGCVVECSEGAAEHDVDTQHVTWTHTGSTGTLRLQVRRP